MFVLRKMWCALLYCYLRFEIRPFALLLTIYLTRRKSGNSNISWEFDFLKVNGDVYQLFEIYYLLPFLKKVWSPSTVLLISSVSNLRIIRTSNFKNKKLKKLQSSNKPRFEAQFLLIG